PSQANFILFTLKADEAGEVFASLKQQGILIKNMGAMPGLPANCLRVTVGTQIENVEFIKQLRGILK
ncbi:MAG: histidinol-phosphate aminotransferase, partial [Cycloclasticus sp.]|nr:histidinol-phosphate aminotransferase [Cycloclasticus sp.]